MFIGENSPDSCKIERFHLKSNIKRYSRNTMETNQYDHQQRSRGVPRLLLLNCFTTRLDFGEDSFAIIFCSSQITISRDNENFAVVGLKNQQVPYKANILGGFAFTEETTGNINYKKYFHIIWEDEYAIPELAFSQIPSKILREYTKGQKIELGVEDASLYHVTYHDGVTADFKRLSEGSYQFEFSTGFTGSFKKEEDGTHSIRFKGLSMESDEDGYKSESKFIISRSKYTNNLLLILQEQASVTVVLGS